MTEKYIDCDVHPWEIGGIGATFPYLSDSWRRRLAPYRNVDAPYSDLGMQLARGPKFPGPRKDAIPPSGGPTGSNVEYFKKHYLDQHPVEVAILLPLQPLRVDAFVNPDEAAMIVAGYNDCFADKWLSVDGRFRLAMVVAPQDPALAVAEIERFGPKRGVVGIMMPLLNVWLGDRRFYPIYDAAQELGLPLILHPNGQESDWVGSPVFAGGTPGFHAERYALFGQFATSNLTSLIFEGIFERFPKLKVVFTEFGWTWVPPLLWRLDATWKAARSTMPWVRKSPTEYVLDHIRFTSEPAIEAPNDLYTSQILTMMDASRTMLFSSDYPHWDADEPDFVFRFLEPAAKHRIFRLNALELFGERLMVAAPAAS